MTFLTGQTGEGPTVPNAPNRKGRRVQLHRALSKLGWGSRSQAWDWIRSGQVQVDGKTITDPLTWVDLDTQSITRVGTEAQRPAIVVLALHKPKGVVTTRSDERGRRTVYDLLPPGLPWVFPAGRLDADSEGLLILTNDSDLAMRLTDPEHLAPKTYRVTLSGFPTEATLDRLRRGITLDDGPTRPAKVELLRRRGTGSVVRMVLREGRNRQVRLMWAAVGHRVRKLVRIAVGGYELGDIRAGECRVLTAEEIGRLREEKSTS